MRTIARVSKMLVLAAIAGTLSFTARAEDWKPADGPLKTKYAKDVTADNALPEYPRPQMVRKDWMTLNGLWQFAPAADAKEEPPIGKDLAGKILVPFPVESALSGVMKPAERVWYRRTFDISPQWAGRRVLLNFGAVDWQATVWLNGKQVGSHKGGYDPFSFDITDAIKPGQPQELVVGVYDPTTRGGQPKGKQSLKPGGIFYTPSTGIWQTVWIEPAPADRIERLLITPDVDNGQILVGAQVTGPAAGVIEIMDSDSGAVLKTVKSDDLSKPSAIKIENVKLWTPDSPYLYGLRVRVEDPAAKTADIVESYFAMRKVELKKVDGITPICLNGKFIFQIGPLDQGFWPDGLYTAPTDDALKSDIVAIKNLGMNMIRKHVKVEPDRWYYWTDKLGVLVWQDMPSGENKTAEDKAQFEVELKAMIDNLRNHPSIIVWVVFNEGWGQYETPRLVDWVKKYDPTRLADNASGWTDRKSGDVIDMHNYPGPKSPAPEENRAAVLGEYGGLGLIVEGHNWQKKGWSYKGTKDGAELTDQFIQRIVKLQELKKNPGLCAAVYTQTTDVEGESNGLMSYDREVFKVDVQKVKAAIDALLKD